MYRFRGVIFGHRLC